MENADKTDIVEGADKRKDRFSVQHKPVFEFLRENQAALLAVMTAERAFLTWLV